MKIVRIVNKEKEYAQPAEIAKLFGMSRRTCADYLNRFYEWKDFNDGEDRIDLKSNYKLIKIQTFKAFLQSIHLKYLKEA